MGPIFSTGMDRLSEKLTKAGFSADVNEFTICRWIGDRAISSYKESPAPIVLIGHSMGGLCSVIISEMAAKENIPISLVITIDPAHATDDVPLNVERFINIFLSDSVLGGGNVVAVPGFRGHYASYDLKENSRVSHINIEKSDDIHRQIIEMVTQLPRIQAAGPGRCGAATLSRAGGYAGRIVGQRRAHAGPPRRHHGEHRRSQPRAVVVARAEQLAAGERNAHSGPVHHRPAASDAAGRRGRDGGAGTSARRAKVVLLHLAPLAGRGRSRSDRVRGTLREFICHHFLLKQPVTPTLSP